MNWMADILTMLGEHFPLMLILSVEVIAAVALAVAAIGRRRKKENPEEYGNIRGSESVFLHELGQRKSEVCILLRREDMMPLFVSGDMESFLGLSLESLQSDISLFRTVFQSAEEADRVWKAYKAWNGQGEFDRQYQLKNNTWVRMIVRRSENTVHEIFTFWDTIKIRGQVEAYEKPIGKQVIRNRFLLSKISLIRFLHFWGSSQHSDGTRRKRISSSHGSMEWSQEDIAG